MAFADCLRLQPVQPCRTRGSDGITLPSRRGARNHGVVPHRPLSVPAAALWGALTKEYERPHCIPTTSRRRFRPDGVLSRLWSLRMSEPVNPSTSPIRSWSRSCATICAHARTSRSRSMLRLRLAPATRSDRGRTRSLHRRGAQRTALLRHYNGDSDYKKDPRVNLVGIRWADLSLRRLARPRQEAKSWQGCHSGSPFQARSKSSSRSLPERPISAPMRRPRASAKPPVSRQPCTTLRRRSRTGSTSRIRHCRRPCSTQPWQPSIVKTITNTSACTA